MPRLSNASDLARVTEIVVDYLSKKKRPRISGTGRFDSLTFYKHQFPYHEACYQAARNYAYRVFTEAELMRWRHRINSRHRERLPPANHLVRITSP